MALTKEKLDLLKDLSAEDKTDILGLMDSIKKKDEEVANLRTKVPKDSEEIVSKTDHKKLKDTIAERDQKIQELDVKLSDLNTRVKATDIITPLDAIWDLFND